MVHMSDMITYIDNGIDNEKETINNEKDNVFFQKVVKELGFEGKQLTIRDMRQVFIYIQETCCL